MENNKNNDEYDNKNYLDKRISPNNAPVLNSLNEIENKTEEKLIDLPKKDDEIKVIENKEMHPEIKRKKSKDFTIPLILGAIFLIIIGVIAVYFLLNTQKESPQQIIKSSMQEMQKVKTYSYNGIIELDVENKENSESFNFDIELSGKTDQADLDNVKAFSNIKLVTDALTEDGSQEFSFDLDTIQLGQKKAYLKLNDFDLGVIGMMMGSEISSLKEKWYEFDLEELKKLSTATTTSGINMATYDVNKIMGLYNKYELLKFQEDLGDVKLGDVGTYHYRVKLDGVALANFYMDIMKEMIIEIDSKNKDKIFKESDEVFKEIQDSIEKYDYAINKVADNVNVEIWIGRDDKLIYRTKINGMFDEEFIKMIEDEMIARGDIVEKDLKNENGLFEFNIDLNMNNFNQPVKINEPENAENFMEVLSGLFGGFLGTGVTETELDTDQDGFPDYLENLYGTDLNNPDTDGDGYKDGEEVENGYDPLIPGNAKLDYDKLLGGI